MLSNRLCTKQFNKEREFPKLSKLLLVFIFLSSFDLKNLKLDTHFPKTKNEADCCHVKF